jgi:hypothetical protein
MIHPSPVACRPSQLCTWKMLGGLLFFLDLSRQLVLRVGQRKTAGAGIRSVREKTVSGVLSTLEKTKRAMNSKGKEDRQYPRQKIQRMHELSQKWFSL